MNRVPTLNITPLATSAMLAMSARSIMSARSAMNNVNPMIATTINTTRERILENQKNYGIFLERLKKKEILSNEEIDMIQGLSCEINKDISLLIQSIVQLKKESPKDTTIYKNLEKAITKAKESQSAWSSALRTAIKYNYSNKLDFNYPKAGRRNRSTRVADKSRKNRLRTYRNKNLKGSSKNKYKYKYRMR